MKTWTSFDGVTENQIDTSSVLRLLPSKSRAKTRCESPKVVPINTNLTNFNIDPLKISKTTKKFEECKTKKLKSR